MKNDWQQNAFIPDAWRLQSGEYTMEVYRNEGERAYRVNGFKGKEQFVIAKPVSPNLGVTKRMANKWMHRHIANTFNTAPQDEQGEALTLATRLEALEALETRLMRAIMEASKYNQTALIEVLEGVLHGD